jgi:transposase-like protein
MSLVDQADELRVRQRDCTHGHFVRTKDSAPLFFCADCNKTFTEEQVWNAQTPFRSTTSGS